MVISVHNFVALCLQKEAENLKDAEASVEESALLDDETLFPYPL